MKADRRSFEWRFFVFEGLSGAGLRQSNKATPAKRDVVSERLEAGIKVGSRRSEEDSLASTKHDNKHNIQGSLPS